MCFNWYLYWYNIYIYFYTLVLFHCFIEVCMKAWNFNWVLTKILIISHYIIRTLGPWQCGQWLAAASGNGWGHAPLLGPLISQCSSSMPAAARALVTVVLASCCLYTGHTSTSQDDSFRYLTSGWVAEYPRVKSQLSSTVSNVKCGVFKCPVIITTPTNQ